MDEHAARRKRLMAQLAPKSAVILFSNPVYERNYENEFPFHQDPNFYYLTGFDEPEAVLVLLPGRKEGEFILFNRPRNPAEEIWVGPRAGQEMAVTQFGADQAFPIAELDQRMPELLEACQHVYCSIGRALEPVQRLHEWIYKLRRKVRYGVGVPQTFHNVDELLHEMRVCKSEHELQLMRKAAEISVHAHRRVMQAARPGMYEYELEAELMYEFYRRGSRSPAYGTILASGANACILHYTANQAQIKDGDLVLVDAGAEYQGYASDITRTFPINGRFTAEQKAVYEIVLRAQVGVIESVKPGLPWDQLQEIADRFITEGLLEVGLLSGKLDKLLETRACQRFFYHRIGHFLGMDTHDAGQYRPNGEWRKLVPGMVFTVEPGVYIAANSEGVDPKWWNIGVRIEDNVVVTERGCEILTAGVPKTVAEIEALMRG